jgi:hypothetical protein
MDANSMFEAYEAIRGTADNPEMQALFDQKVSEFVLLSLGTASVAATAASPEVSTVATLPESDTNLLFSVSEFLDGSRSMTAQEQVTFLQSFWGVLGHDMPLPSNEQLSELQAKLDRNPGQRIMLAPLLDLDGRKAVVEAARRFPKNQFTKTATALWTPGPSWVFGRLLEDPMSTTKDGKTTFGLRYKAATNANGLTVVTRKDYQESLTTQGKTLSGEHGVVWTVSVTDVQKDTDRTYSRADRLFIDRVHPTQTPELELATVLMHQANGDPNTRWDVNFVNEAIYPINRNGEVAKAVPSRVASVYWYQDSRQVDLDRWRGGDQFVFFGVRAEESGL